MVGKLAVSLAGHDKDTLYLIIKEEGDSIYLVDGVYKKYAAPKKKNRRHIQPVSWGITEDQLRELAQNPADADTKIKKYLKTFSERKEGKYV
ncbi:MAG: hypothetical protein IJ390_00840 [Lachnospiraceae bacterium]|nr:hypothetical protein [Lachnospiraceae bacterium]